MTTTKLSMPQIWWEAARPRTLPAAAAPVLLGMAVAWSLGSFRAVPAVLALLGALAIQVGTNYANDYYDARNGADTAARIGPRRATQAGLVTPQQMWWAFVITFVIAAIIGVALMMLSSVALLWVGVASIVSGILYTGGPKPLGYLGLGDVLVFIFFGPVAVAGTVFVQSVAVSPLAIAAGAATGLLSTAILVVNNLRDRVTDVDANKRTLAVRFGARAVRIEYALCVVGAYAVAIGLAVWLHQPWLCLPWLSVPRGVVLVRRLFSTDGAALNPMLGATAQLLLLFSLLLAIGFVGGGG
jgi:1,4-dihydroxy-2-naphthoate polyprenyltransferase